METTKWVFNIVNENRKRPFNPVHYSVFHSIFSVGMAFASRRSDEKRKYSLHLHVTSPGIFATERGLGAFVSFRVCLETFLALQ